MPGTGPDLRTTLQHIVDTATALAGAHHGALALLDSGDRHVTDLFTSGMSEAEHRDAAPLLHGRTGILGALVDDAQAVRVDDLTARPHPGARPSGELRPRSFIGAPVRVHTEVLGSLCLTAPEPGSFDDTDLALLRLLASRSIWSSPGSRALPPTIMIPESAMSATRSGGQSRSTLPSPSSTAVSGVWMAWRTAAVSTCTERARPVATSRPWISVIAGPLSVRPLPRRASWSGRTDWLGSISSWCWRRCWITAWSMASPPTGMRTAVTIEPSESTAIWVVAAPHTMIMEAVGCSTGSPQPTAAAISVSTSSTRRAPSPTRVSTAARWPSGRPWRPSWGSAPGAWSWSTR